MGHRRFTIAYQAGNSRKVKLDTYIKNIYCVHAVVGKNINTAVGKVFEITSLSQ